MKVFTKNEYSPLKSVMLGSVENFTWPTNDKEFDSAIARSTYHKKLESTTLPKWLTEEAKEDLDALESLMQDHGVKVHRPTITGPQWAYSARDIILTVGDMIILCPTPFESRANEIELYPFLRECKKIKAPRPSYHDDPCFDAANVLKINDKLLYSLSHSANESGAEWLQQQVGTDFEVVKWSVVDHDITHIDSTLLTLNENTVIVNASRVKEKDLPEFMKDFNKIWIDDVVSRDFYKFPYASKWIGMNMFSLDPETVVVDEIQTGIKEQLEANNFKVITTPMRHSRTLGGGFHCVTNDLERE